MGPNSPICIRLKFGWPRKSALATGFRPALQGPQAPSFHAPPAWFPARNALPRNDEKGCDVRGLRAGPLVAHGLQFHRAIRNRHAEGRADGAFDQMDVAAMGADQLV